MLAKERDRLKILHEVKKRHPKAGSGGVGASFRKPTTRQTHYDL